MHQPATRMQYQHFSFFLSHTRPWISRNHHLRTFIDALWDQGRRLSPSAITIQHRSFDRTFGIPRMTLSFSRDAHTLTFSLFLLLCLSSFFSSSSSPSTFPVHPPPVYVRGSRRITASSRERLALGNNRHGPNVLSSPPANQVNPINALGRPQTKKLPPGTLALSRERYVFVLKCPFWSSSSVISTAISNHGK